MSLFGSLMGDMEEDPIFGNHMSMMRQMNTMMNSFFGGGNGGNDPFSLMGGGFNMNPRQRGLSMMPAFSMPIMPNFNRLLSGQMDPPPMNNSHCYSSSTVVSMTSGPDGRPQVYKATSSTRTAPGGIKETQKSVTDTRSGTKKLAIGHHIGDRAHIIEKEQNMHTGDKEERQDFINLEEDEAEDFNKEWETKSRSRSEIPRITSGVNRSHHHHHHRHNAGTGNQPMLAITGGPRRRQRERQTSPLIPSSRRSIRASPLTVVSTTSPSSRTPYSPPGHIQGRKCKNIKSVSGPSTTLTPPPNQSSSTSE